jgi:hypothetical protein
MEITTRKFSPSFSVELSFSWGWMLIELPFFSLLIVSDKKAKELDAM